MIEGRSPWRLVADRLRRDRVGMAAVIAIVIIIVLALAAPLIAQLIGHASEAQFRDTGLSESGMPVAPGATFLFGTDGLGRDVFVRVLYGARISLFAGVVSTGMAIVVGVFVGLLSGYFGGVVDHVLARTMDVLLSFPFLVVAIALVSVVGPSLTISIALIAFFSWAGVGRIVRGQVLSLREAEYVQAARSLGASDWRIMFVDILPNVLAPVIVFTTLLIPGAIVAESTMSFLGLGVVPPTATWGNMLAEAIAYYRVAWWFVVCPGVALLVTTVAFNLLGDSVRDALDPRHQTLIAPAGGKDA